METVMDVRMDKWLWAVRVYKTRSLASEACRAGHVKVGDQAAKSSRSVRIGEVIRAQVGPMTRTVKVIGLIEHRVGAEAAKQFMEDLTPPEEYQKRSEPAQQPVFVRPKGTGRPTKKDRRKLNPFLGSP